MAGHPQPLQFRIRTLLIVTAVTAVFLALAVALPGIGTVILFDAAILGVLLFTFLLKYATLRMDHCPRLVRDGATVLVVSAIAIAILAAFGNLAIVVLTTLYWSSK